MREFLLSMQPLLIATGLLILLFSSPAMAEKRLEVGVALKVNQITSIDQKSENFGVVATLRMEWLIPELAAESVKQAPPQRLYRAEDFLKILTERHLTWPAHSFDNLQGRIDYQNRMVAVDPQGKVIYMAKFTGTFQAPDFDFKQWLESIKPIALIVIAALVIGILAVVFFSYSNYQFLQDAGPAAAAVVIPAGG